MSTSFSLRFEIVSLPPIRPPKPLKGAIWWTPRHTNTSGVKLAEISLKNVSQLQRYFISIRKIFADILSEIFYAVSFAAGFTPGELQYLVREEFPPLSLDQVIQLFPNTNTNTNTNTIFGQKRVFLSIQLGFQKTACGSNSRISFCKIPQLERLHHSPPLSGPPQKEDLFIFHRLVGWVPWQFW